MKKKLVIVLVSVVLILLIIVSISSYKKSVNQRKIDSQYELQQSQIDSLIINHYERDYTKAIAYAESLITNIKDDWSYYTNDFYSYYIDMLLKTHQYNKALLECIEWQKVVSQYEDLDYIKQYPLIGLMISYYYLEDYKNLDKILKSIRHDYFTNKVNNIYTGITEQTILRWYIKILLKYKNNIDSTQSIINHFDYLSLYHINAQIIADENANNAIDYIKENQILFNDYCMGLAYRKAVGFEESNMLLSYLYYKNDDKENALKYFKQSLDKEDGSTFNGDWDFWLNYREYYKDQFEVLTKLKNIYNNANSDEKLE